MDTSVGHETYHDKQPSDIVAMVLMVLMVLMEATSLLALGHFLYLQICKTFSSSVLMCKMI